MNHQKTLPVFKHGIRPLLAAAAAAFVLAGCPNPAKTDNPSNPTKTTPGLTPAPVRSFRTYAAAP